MKHYFLMVRKNEILNKAQIEEHMDASYLIILFYSISLLFFTPFYRTI